MLIETGFILAAGFGTRMGIIGKSVPKVLWPIFDTTLLGLQIHFLKDLGIKNIYINVHHQKELVIDYCEKKFPDVNILVENEILDAGGGVHNFIEKSKISNSFIVLNSDQFFKVDIEQIRSKLSLESIHRAKLFTMNGNSDYSSLNLNQDGRLIGISTKVNGPMFIGLSIVNPIGLKVSLGKSKFFETVCNYQNESIYTQAIEGDFLDFGDCEKYHKSAYKLFKFLQENKEKRDDWINKKIISKNKLYKESYGCEQSGVLNFSDLAITNQYLEKAIVLKESMSQKLVKYKSIVYNGVIQEVNY